MWRTYLTVVFFYIHCSGIIELCSLTQIRVQIGLKINCFQDGNNFQLLCMDSIHIFLFYSNSILAGLVVFFFSAQHIHYIYTLYPLMRKQGWPLGSTKMTNVHTNHSRIRVIINRVHEGWSTRGGDKFNSVMGSDK